MKKNLFFVCGALACSRAWAADATISVDASKPGARISPTLYGAFFEEINRAGDGGIYAEMVQNRSFEDAPMPLGWTFFKSDGSTASFALDKTTPLNARNPTSLRLDIAQNGGRVGVSSEGFKGAPWGKDFDAAKAGEWETNFNSAAKKSSDGLAVVGRKALDFSLYARAANFDGPLSVSIETQNGTVLASSKITGVGASWKKFETTLTPSASDSNARLVVSATNSGTVWLDMVSLFPRDTFKNRKNGLRADLAQMIADTHPAFLRFPGGSYVEGAALKDAYHWKDTIGDVAQRPGHWNIWGYRSSDGLGFHEYLQLCEDLNAVPLYVANCGMAERDFAPLDGLEPWIQEALDAVEYANGDAKTTKWGAERARNGHPQPFGLKYLEIGNENGLAFSWGGGKREDYLPRYRPFFERIKAKYPDIITIANIDTTPDVPAEIVDEHYYNSAPWFEQQATRYDSYDRTKRPLYIGEFAVTNNAGGGNLNAALGEAAFMTGLERNGDVVRMSSYAPLFVRPSWRKWNPNAIVFDGARAYGTPSYYVQAMFAANRGDVVLPVKIQQDAPPVAGKIGVGTWNTQAQFRDIQVSKNGQSLFQSDFSRDLSGGQTVGGAWSAVDGAASQSGTTNDTRLLFGDATWSDYTLSLKARKTGGSEGFLISFQLPDAQTVSWWNIGGWGNSKSGLEVPGVTAPQVPLQIETNRWYDIKIELKGASIRCFLDGKLLHDVTRTGVPTLFAVAGRQDKSGDLVVKVVNPASAPATTSLQLRGAGRISPGATAIVLSSASATDENSFETPTKIAPRTEQITATAAFSHVFPANSVTILRFKTAR